jgi:hypothetical protein
MGRGGPFQLKPFAVCYALTLLKRDPEPVRSPARDPLSPGDPPGLPEVHRKATPPKYPPFSSRQIRPSENPRDTLYCWKLFSWLRFLDSDLLAATQVSRHRSPALAFPLFAKLILGTAARTAEHIF